MSNSLRSCLLLLVVGCGGGDNTTPDSSPADTTPDSTTPDGPPAPVTFTARERLVPAAGVRVAFLADDDSVIENVVTDATGSATVRMDAGGKIVAMGPTSTTGHLWLGVKPGDAIALDLGGVESETTTVIVPTVGNSIYQVESGCSSSFTTAQGATATLAIVPGCTSTDLVIYRQVGGNIVDALVRENQSLLPNATLDLSAMSYTAMVDRTVEVSDAPATTLGVFLEGSRALNLEPTLGRFADRLVPTNGAASIGGKLVDVGAAQLSQVVAQGNDETHIVMRRGGSSTISLAGILLPAVSAPVFATRTLTWTQAATGQPADGVFAQLLFGPVQWFIAGPASTSLAIPALPAEMSAIDPADLTFQRAQVRLFDTPGNFDDARGVIFSVRSARGLLPADGQLVISESASLRD